MHLIALSGGSYSGKTTLAEELEARGYLRIQFSDGLKQIAVGMLEPWMPELDLEEMKVLKGMYRPFLQELGRLIGFDTNPGFVNLSLRAWWQAGMPKAVFDCVRFPEQYAVLKQYGFRLVYLDAPTEVRKARAKKWGVSARSFNAAEKHPAERVLPEAFTDPNYSSLLSDRLTLSAVLPSTTLADQLLEMDAVHA